MYKAPDLTPKEKDEFSELRKKLFGDSKFRIFSEEDENSEEMKRYNILINKRVAHLKSIDQLI